MKIRALPAFLFLLLVLPAGCGDSPGELVVIERREPRTLLRQGTAITEDEAARRRTESDEAARRVKAQQELLRAQNRLKGAKTATQRADVLGQIGRLGAHADPAIEAVEACLRDEDADVRIAALEARLLIRDEGGDALVLRALEAEEGRVRRAAVELWAARRPDQPGPLLKALRDDDEGVQYAAMSAFGAGSHLPNDLLEEIAAGLEDYSGSVAKVAFQILLPRRDRLRDFEAAVAVLLDHQDQTVRLSVIDKAMAARIFSKGLAAKIVQTVVEDPEPSVRSGCLGWLRDLAPSPPPDFDVSLDDQERWRARGPLLAWLEALPK